MPDDDRFYRCDARDMPAYSLSDAAQYLQIPTATLASWVRGRQYDTFDGRAEFAPLIEPPIGADRSRLSFNNLVEAHVLRALRVKHSVPIQVVREALTAAEETLNISRLLLSRDLLTGGQELFLQRYGMLLKLDRSRQIGMKQLLITHLNRVERDEEMLPRKLFPFIPGFASSRAVVIDPRVSFGKPTVARSGISTQAIARRINAGESLRSVALDYAITENDIKRGLIFETAA